MIMPVPGNLNQLARQLKTHLTSLQHNDLGHALDQFSDEYNKQQNAKQYLFNIFKQMIAFLTELTAWVQARHYQGDEQGLQALYVALKSYSDEVFNYIVEQQQFAEQEQNSLTPKPNFMAQLYKELDEDEQKKLEKELALQKELQGDGAGLLLVYLMTLQLNTISLFAKLKKMLADPAVSTSQVLNSPMFAEIISLSGNYDDLIPTAVQLFDQNQAPVVSVSQSRSAFTSTLQPRPSPSVSSPAPEENQQDQVSELLKKMMQPRPPWDQQ